MSRVATGAQEGQLQLTSLDDDVREVKQVNLKRVQHTLASHNDLFFDR